MNADDPAKTILSIVIPVLNEEQNVAPLSEQLKNTLKATSISYELIFVDDGSQDGTWESIQELAAHDDTIKGISLSRNFGQQHAILSGLACARGEAIISMDGDLQHPPELVLNLYKKWREGYKIVNTKRIHSSKTPLLKRLLSKYYYRFFSMISGLKIEEGSSDFRLIDRQILESILKFNDVNFFFRGIISWVGFPVTSVEYTEHNRIASKSNYSLRRMMDLAFSGIIAFTSFPLKIGIWIGLATSLLATLELIYILIKFMQGVTVPGWASMVGVTSLLFSILFILLGCIGLYIANIHESLKNRPRYIIKDKINV